MHDISIDICQPKITSLISVGQFLVMVTDLVGCDEDEPEKVKPKVLMKNLRKESFGRRTVPK